MAGAMKAASKVYTKKPKAPKVEVEGMTWIQFVKKVQLESKCSYKEALQKASPLWQEAKGKQVKPVPDLTKTLRPTPTVRCGQRVVPT
eukprot:34871-Eustigmatos_ZCMA.PRE.1